MAQESGPGQGFHAALILRGPIAARLKHLRPGQVELLQEIRPGDVDLAPIRP